MQNYLDQLNDAQRAAVENTEGAALVIAGAGSGKTRVLTYRIAHLLAQAKRPSSILALTFTNKAAREMKQRIAQLVGSERTRFLWMGTFHAIFARILRIEHQAVGFPQDYTIYDPQDSKSLLKTVIKELNLDVNQYKVNDVLSRISWAKNNLITPETYEGHAEIQKQDIGRRKQYLTQIYKTYVNRCRRAGAMDFDDLLLQTNILFRDHKDILAKYQEKFQYILVDEYQDTNYAQYLIVKKLAAVHKNVCVVGDDAQSIYAFRGAKIENIFNFKNDYPGYTLYKLERNYRSTQNIVKAANSIIAKNENQIQKEVYSKKDQGPRLKLKSTVSDIEEGYYVADSIQQTHVRGHVPFDGFAILYRTNAQSRIFEEALRKQNIPYRIYGGLSFYQRKEIKDLLAYLRLTVNPHDDEALKRTINYPKRGIGARTVAKAEQAAFKNDRSLWEILARPQAYELKIATATLNRMKEFIKLINYFQGLLKEDAYDAASEIASKSGILKELYNDKTPEGLGRHENIQEILNGIQDFAQQREETDQEATLEEYLAEVALLTSQDEDDEEAEKVTLMTIHSAKGLEFKHVFLVGLEEDLFPSKMASQSQNDIEEERRLFYVAVTRAEAGLSLSYARQRFRWGSLLPTTPSRFLRDIEERYLDMDDSSFLTDSQAATEPRVQQQVARHGRPKAKGGAPAGYRRINNKPGISEKASAQGYRILTTDDIAAGIYVEHFRFGKGKVLKIDGTFPNTKAVIDFASQGKKNLLLKFAKLRLLDE